MGFFSKFLLKNPYIYSKARRAKHILFGYPEKELELLRFLVDPDRIAIDVGAHSGLYTAELLRFCKCVIAIEALPTLARKIDQAYSSARIINAAASFEEGNATLYVPVGRPGLSTISSENPVAIEHCAEVHVKTVMLDHVVDGPVGFIKIDVEGNELNVLRGALAVLRRDKPVLLIEAEERHRQGAVASLQEFLAPLGYKGLMLDNGRLRPLEMFDAVLDQNVTPANLDALNAGVYDGHYINNFIFIA